MSTNQPPGTGGFFQVNDNDWVKLNQALRYICNSLDQLTGRRGNPTFYSDLVLSGFKATNAGDPSAATDLVTKQYADAHYGHSSSGSSSGNTGFASIVAFARKTAQTGAVTNFVTFTPGADATLQISANVLTTVSSAENFQVLVAYHDEGNTSRSLPLWFSDPAGVTPYNSIISGHGAVPSLGFPMHIRVKGSTAVTVSTSGTFTGATYNVEAVIWQLQ